MFQSDMESNSILYPLEYRRSLSSINSANKYPTLPFWRLLLHASLPPWQTLAYPYPTPRHRQHYVQLYALFLGTMYWGLELHTFVKL